MARLRSWQFVVGMVGLLGCKEPSGAGSPAPDTGGWSSAGGIATGGIASAGPTRYSVETSSLSDPGWFAAGGSSGGGGSETGGSPPQPVSPPFGESTDCGDAIVGLDEECDDGGGGADACTAECHTRDQAVAVPPAAEVEPWLLPERSQGAGRHPIAGLNDGFISSYIEVDTLDQEPAVYATLFDIWGRPTARGRVSGGATPVDDANPVAAALPGGKYVVAWTDFDGDGSDLGVALRGVSADGELGPLVAANAGREFSQLNPDVIWTGTQLVVAWEDFSDAANGPDLRYRLFDANLTALSGDLSLASSASPEAQVALAPFAGGFAAAYREGAEDGLENIVVKANGQTYRAGPFLGAAMTDRPALVALDATRLLLVFSAAPPESGAVATSRLQYALVDTESSSPLVARPLDALYEGFAAESKVTQSSPSAVAGPGGAYVAWRSEAQPGDASGDQVWLRRLRWVGTGPSAVLSADEPELLLPRTCDASIGDQRAPALGFSGLPPSGALIASWDDFGKTSGTSAAAPEVVVHYAPLRAEVSAPPQSLTETWSGPSGTAWPRRWSSDAATSATLSTQAREGDLQRYGMPWTATAWVNDHTARDVDLTLTARFGNPYQHIGLFARRADDQPNTYVGATFNTAKGDTWRIYAVTADAAGQPVTTVLKSLPLPTGAWWVGVGVQVDFRLRFRVETQADGSVFLGMKWWRLGADEPADWSLETTEPPSSLVATELGARAGRFGLMGAVPTGNGGRMAFDDFSARFFEGTSTGSLDAAPSSAALLLPRDTAEYRRCREGQPCAFADGCCEVQADCEAGLTCDPRSGQAFGVGSHAATCVSQHCANAQRDADEEHADCGGADCAVCSCAVVAKGASGYCSEGCPCGLGDYPCARHADCLPGLWCGAETGEPFGSATSVSACVPLHCLNRVQDENETAIDCGGDCGSNCDVCSPANGTVGHCRTYCQCETGEGNCRNDDDCVAPLTCAPKALNYGLSSANFVCVPPHCLNRVKDTALGETSIDFGGECSASTGLSASSFPPLLYRPVSYALETGDFMVLPTATPLVGTVTTPVLRGYNRFILNVTTTGNVYVTFNVGNAGLPSNPDITVKSFNRIGTTLRSQVVPSSDGNPSLSTSVLIGWLGAGNYEVDVTPSDSALTYSLTRDASVTLALKDGADLSGPTAAPLYFYVPAELARGFIYADFDPGTPLQLRDPSNNVVTPLQVTSQIYALDTEGKPGVWSATFRTSSPRAHLINLPDVFSFDPNAVITSKIIRTALDYGTPPTTATTTQYLRGENRFVFHVSSPTVQNAFTFTLENTSTPPPFEVRLQRLDGTHLGASPYTPALGDNVLDAGLLPVGDYEFWVTNPGATPRYKITIPAGISFAAVDGFNVGNVWFPGYRDYFYVPPGTTSVRFGAPVPTTIFKVYDPTGTLQSSVPVPLGNNVYEFATPTSGTWALNVQGATNLRFLNIPQVVGMTAGITATPLPSPPFGCTSSASCGAGEECGTDNGARFGRPATDDLCWPSTCAAAPAGACGSILSPCGTCPN
jgi:hypothetical protein